MIDHLHPLYVVHICYSIGDFHDLKCSQRVLEHVQNDLRVLTLLDRTAYLH